MATAQHLTFGQRPRSAWDGNMRTPMAANTTVLLLHKPRHAAIAHLSSKLVVLNGVVVGRGTTQLPYSARKLYCRVGFLHLPLALDQQPKAAPSCPSAAFTPASSSACK